ALIEMMKLDLISFTESYDNKGVIVTADENGEPIKYKLTQEEELALINLDLAKEELVSIYSFKSTNGSIRYDLPPDKQSKVHDDRAYTIAMLAWYLQQLRRSNITERKNQNVNASDFFLSQKPKQYR